MLQRNDRLIALTWLLMALAALACAMRHAFLRVLGGTDAGY